MCTSWSNLINIIFKLYFFISIIRKSYLKKFKKYVYEFAKSYNWNDWYDFKLYSKNSSDIILLKIGLNQSCPVETSFQYNKITLLTH